VEVMIVLHSAVNVGRIFYLTYQRHWSIGVVSG
jgi:hypothetical protein